MTGLLQCMLRSISLLRFTAAAHRSPHQRFRRERSSGVGSRRSQKRSFGGAREGGGGGAFFYHVPCSHVPATPRTHVSLTLSPVECGTSHFSGVQVITQARRCAAAGFAADGHHHMYTSAKELALTITARPPWPGSPLRHEIARPFVSNSKGSKPPCTR